ncbi:MAG: glycogen/starch synthase [Desulfobacteraceae bacterium]|nr:glycogen/starch synthase [Desulfobacteraceae bacterium]
MAKKQAPDAPSPAPAISSVWLVTREYEGLAGAGGVKDFSRQLAGALARTGRRVRVVLPLYGFMQPEKLGFAPLDHAFDVDMPYVGVERRELVRIWERQERPAGGPERGQGSLAIYLLDAQRYREKGGVYTYTAAEEAANPLLHKQGAGHYDYFAMNVLLQKGALGLMIRLGERPEIIHCQDGHTAILPALMREIEGYRHHFAASGAVVTIHNAGRGYHQEVDDLPFAQVITGLPKRLITANLLDGGFDPFLAASSYAPLNTVSENYARELQETNDDLLTGWLGHHLAARGVKLAGITNGIEPEAYDPRRPKPLGLAAGFDPAKGEMAGKAKCRRALVRDIAGGAITGVTQEGALDPEGRGPLFTFIGRFTEQKGVDKLEDALASLLPHDPDFQVLIQGSGSREHEEALARLATAEPYRGRVCILRGYDPLLANQVFAAGDFLLVPSRYEPCGLTDFIAQLFGNLPIVHHVGGLVKVIDRKTGFAYKEHSSAALMGAMQSALRLYREQPATIAAMQREAVRVIHEQYTWETVVKQYLALYREALTFQGPRIKAGP